MGLASVRAEHLKSPLSVLESRKDRDGVIERGPSFPQLKVARGSVVGSLGRLDATRF
jgi:hypothetical protein